MPDDKRIDVLEGELKLIKGEVQQSITDVRNFLNNLKLPDSPVLEKILGVGSEENKTSINGGLGLDYSRDMAAEPQPQQNKPAAQTPAAKESEPERTAAPRQPEKPSYTGAANNVHQLGSSAPYAPAPASLISSPAQAMAMPEMPRISPGKMMLLPNSPEPEEEIDEKEPENKKELKNNESEQTDMEAEMKQQNQEQSTPATPQVNMLANLIRWVSHARGKIGADQLPVILEVYGICGNLSIELKETIIRLAEAIGQSPEGTAEADMWSQLILELHGILSGGGSPLQPLHSINLKAEETVKEAAPEEPEKLAQPAAVAQPIRLKLVLPVEGGEQEFTLNLAPGPNGHSSEK